MSENTTQSGAATLPVPPIIDDEAERWRSVASQVGHIDSAKSLWENVLTERQRNAFGGNFLKTIDEFGTVGMMAIVWKTTRALAELDAAWALGLIRKIEYMHRFKVIAPFEASTSRSKIETPMNGKDGRRKGAVQDTIERAKEANKLVVVFGAGYRKVYFRDKDIGGDWTEKNKVWMFFWQLAKAASDNLGVDRQDTESDTARTFQQTRYRLGKKLPSRLNALILAGDTGEYRLTLSKDQVEVFEISAGDEVDLDEEDGNLASAIAAARSARAAAR
jgi:hypothetical protein